jgi:Chromo (CHRromatin Organisation MOdifier) domain
VKVNEFLTRHQLLVLEAKDNLRTAKFNQAFAANQGRSPDPKFEVGDRVMLSTENCRREYKSKGSKRAAKFFPRWDGPYEVVQAYPATSTYTLDLPESMNIFPTFHATQLKLYHANDDSMFPTRAHIRPPPLKFADGSEEYFIDSILDERKIGRGRRYLVRWKGYGVEDDSWVAGAELKGTDALKDWETKNAVN